MCPVASKTFQKAFLTIADHPFRFGSFIVLCKNRVCQKAKAYTREKLVRFYLILFVHIADHGILARSDYVVLHNIHTGACPDAVCTGFNHGCSIFVGPDTAGSFYTH